jgi:hypothetical protein
MPEANIPAYHPRIDALRQKTGAGVSIDLTVWYHSGAEPLVDWTVSTFDATGKCLLHHGADLEGAMANAEACHGIRTGAVPVVVTP